MAVSVNIPAAMKPLVGNQDEVQVNAGTIGEMLSALTSTYPGIQERLYDAQGKLRLRFVNIFVNGDDIRVLQREETPLKDGDEVSLIPAIAGGRDS